MKLYEKKKEIFPNLLSGGGKKFELTWIRYTRPRLRILSENAFSWRKRNCPLSA